MLDLGIDGMGRVGDDGTYDMNECTIGVVENFLDGGRAASKVVESLGGEDTSICTDG